MSVCIGCREESFFDLQLNVKGNKSCEFPSAISILTSLSLSVLESFKSYTAAETLDGDNKYHAGSHGMQVGNMLRVCCFGCWHSRTLFVGRLPTNISRIRTSRTADAACAWPALYSLIFLYNNLLLLFKFKCVCVCFAVDCSSYCIVHQDTSCAPSSADEVPI